MKQARTFKSILVIVSFLSLLAFMFVNLHANSSLKHPFSTSIMPQNELQSEETADSGKIPVADLSVLGRVWEIAQRLLDKAN